MRLYLFLTIAGLTLTASSCKKEWLDAKPDDAQVIPSTIEDFQKLVDNALLNQNQPALGEIGSDDYYVTASSLQSITATSKNAYLWLPDVYQGTLPADWTRPYQQIFYANNALEGLERIERNASNQSAWNNVKGSALFYRAFAYYSLAQLFCKPYIPASAATDLGLPLRLTSDITSGVSRSSVQATYDQIISDLTEASVLLPNFPLTGIKTRPSKNAVFAMLARTYLTMGNYSKSLSYSDSSLQLNKVLLDYNNTGATPTETVIAPAATQSFARLNNEVIFHTAMPNNTIFATSRLIVDSSLYATYNNNDIRKTAFFRTISGSITFKGSYFQSVILFAGVANDEVYFIRAESNARLGNTAAALKDLDSVMIKRMKTGFFQPATAATQADALNRILQERRKELVFRGLRWTDLRRLNSEGRNIVLTRIVNGQTYTLPANDKKYVLPIPQSEIASTGIEQNDR